MNRRDFLKGAAVSAAGAAIGGCATAGTAALCVKGGTTPRALAAESLTAKLREQGAFLG